MAPWPISITPRPVRSWYSTAAITIAPSSATAIGVMGIFLSLQSSGFIPCARCQGLPRTVYQAAPNSHPASPAELIAMSALCMGSLPIFGQASTAQIYAKRPGCRPERLPLKARFSGRPSAFSGL